MGHLMGEFDILMSTDHDGHIAVRAGLHQHPGVGNDTGFLELTDKRDISLHMLAELADHHRHRVSGWEFGEAHQVLTTTVGSFVAGMFVISTVLLKTQCGQAGDRIAEW